ncbi:MAG: hypothetical protein BWX49_01669 [Bacteroidetes bacterium ADurb.Bin008]|nr:MAG: hypothetical protein BWX49_01669 [Bacteroidetes bacterium ADurb.Bin008]
MEYTALIPVLIEGMKEQQKIIESQQQIAREQKNEIDALRAEIEQLKQLMVK